MYSSEIKILVELQSKCQNVSRDEQEVEKDINGSPCTMELSPKAFVNNNIIGMFLSIIYECPCENVDKCSGEESISRTK